MKSRDVGADINEVELTDLVEGEYEVKVIAYDHSGHSKSVEISGLIVDRTAPAAPQLTLGEINQDNVLLSWTTTDQATDYIILYGLEPGNYLYDYA